MQYVHTPVRKLHLEYERCERELERERERGRERESIFVYVCVYVLWLMQ